MSDGPAESAPTAPPPGAGRPIHAVNVPGVVVSPPPGTPPPTTAPPSAPPTQIPWLGLTAVLLGHFHFDAEHAVVLVRARGYPRRRTRRLRRWRLDHDLADDGANADLPCRHLAGHGFRPAKSAARSRRGVRRHRIHRAVLGQPTHAVGFAVPGRPRNGLLRAAHAELRIAEHAAEVLGVRHSALCVEPGGLAQHLRLVRGLVRRSPLVALDLLAAGAAGDRHGVVPVFRHPSRPRQPGAAQAGLCRLRLRRHRTVAHLRSS